MPETPPFLYDNSFSNYDITLKTSENALEAYSNTEPWSKFSKIVALTPADMKSGDVNGDGIVNAADLVCVVNIIKKGATDIEISLADMNGDGVVNSYDIVIITNIIMEKK